MEEMFKEKKLLTMSTSPVSHEKKNEIRQSLTIYISMSI